MKRIILTVMMLSPVFIACSHSRIQTEFTSNETISRESKDKDFQVSIIGKDQIEKPYKIIGTVSAMRSEEGDPMEVFERMKKMARKKGGDALMDLDVIVRIRKDFSPDPSVEYRAQIIAYDNLGGIQAMR